MKKSPFLERIITVYCSTCKDRIDETTVDVLDCEEGDRGQDVVTFVCPKCQTTNKSSRVG